MSLDETENGIEEVIIGAVGIIATLISKKTNYAKEKHFVSCDA